MMDFVKSSAPAQYKLSNNGLTWEKLPPTLRTFPEPRQYSWMTLPSRQIWELSHYWVKPRLTCTGSVWWGEPSCRHRADPRPTSLGPLRSGQGWWPSLQPPSSSTCSSTQLSSILLSGISPPMSIPHMASLSHMFLSPNGFRAKGQLWTIIESLDDQKDVYHYKIYCFSYPFSMMLWKGDGSVFESQDLFKYMYSIKFSNRTHKIQLVIEINSQ